MVAKNDNKIDAVAVAEAAAVEAAQAAEKASQTAREAQAALEAARETKRQAERVVARAREAEKVRERTAQLKEDWEFVIGSPAGDSAAANINGAYVEVAVLDWGNLVTSVTVPGEDLVEFAKAILKKSDK